MTDTVARNEGRTGAETSSLREAIGRPPARVLDVACGSGRHAIALAQAGFSVTGIDGSNEALERARDTAARVGVSVRFVECDLLAIDVELPEGEIDTAICMRTEGWRDDPAHVRLLRAVRDRMNERGVLVVAAASPSDPPALTDAGDVSGLVRLLRASGFEIAGLRSDALARTGPESDGCSVLIVARPIPAAPAGLAHHAHQAQAGTSPAVLNLKWSPDEAGFLDRTADEIWSPLLADPDGLARLSREYALTDAWGGFRSAPVLSEFFGVDLPPDHIVFGAGATGLLRQVAPLVRGGTLLAMRLVHRDFPVWAAAESARIDWIEGGFDGERTLEALNAGSPDAVYLERPSPAGAIMPLAGVAAVCGQALRRGALVVVDEAYLAYFAGAGSAAALVGGADNLIVIRSLSKAYCCGGLRVGFAVCGAAAARLLRRVAAPLQVSELAFQMALRLLQAGDIFRRLRHRIEESKREMTTISTRSGLEIVSGDGRLPWVLVNDPAGGRQEDLARRGIEGKRLVPFSPLDPSGQGWLRLAVPLSAERRARFLELLGGR